MIDVNKLKNKLSELENLQDLLANNTISPEQYKYKAEHIISQCREKRDILVAFAPSVLFPIAVIVLGASLWFDFRDIYPLKWIVIDPLKWINADHTAGLLCTSTIPRVLGSLYVFMAIILIWVVFAWLVVHWRSCDKPTLTLEHMARLHYVQSELWFSIILLILSLNLGLALFSVFYLKCDTSIINTIKEFAVTPDKTWLVVFEHALPLLSLNGFALTSVVLGFLWARRGYQAHSHNNMIFEHKATYWAIIMTKPGKEASELLREVIRVSPSSGYEEGTQAIQLVGISAPPKP